MKTDFMVRNVLLVLAFVNQVLTACGKNVLPIEDETLATLLTTGFTIVILAANMRARRRFNAVNLDGGGSIPCSFGGESRMVHNYIAVRVKPKKFRIARQGEIAPGAVACGRRETDLTRDLIPRSKSVRTPFSNMTIAGPSVHLCNDLFHRNGSHNDYVLEVNFNICVKDMGNSKRKDSEAM